MIIQRWPWKIAGFFAVLNPFQPSVAVRRNQFSEFQCKSVDYLQCSTGLDWVITFTKTFFSISKTASLEHFCVINHFKKEPLCFSLKQNTGCFLKSFLTPLLRIQPSVAVHRNQSSEFQCKSVDYLQCNTGLNWIITFTKTFFSISKTASLERFCVTNHFKKEPLCFSLKQSTGCFLKSFLTPLLRILKKYIWRITICKKCKKSS